VAGGFGRWWSRYWWLVLTATAVTAFVLAYVGGEGAWLSLSRLNTALLILPFGLSVQGEESTALQVARILAPIVFAYATFRALVVVFGERMQDLRAGFAQGHTIVAGLGRQGQSLVESLLAGSRKVVAVEQDASNPAIRRLRDAGAVVLVGDSTENDVLERAGARRAAHIVSVCGADATNAQVAANVLALSNGRPDSKPALFVHVSDARLFTFMLHHSFAAADTWLEFFNIYERGALGLLREAHPEDAEAPSEVLVLGAGQLGSALISQLARERYELLKTTPDAGPVRVNLVDRVAFERAAALADRYSRLSDACTLRTFELDVESPAFDRLLERNPELAEVEAAFVCFDDDSVGIAAALSLLEQARGRFPVIARVTSRSEGIAGLIQEAHRGFADATTFLPVSVAERACHADLVLGGMRSQLAHEIHETYRRGQTGGPYDVPWAELTEEGRSRNLRHADALSGQLRAAGYRLGPLLDWGAPLEELTPEEVELVSELEHERWMTERLGEGWTLGSVRDDQKKQHPDLRPWSKLPPVQQDINRRFVRERIAMLARVGIQVYRA